MRRSDNYRTTFLKYFLSSWDLQNFSAPFLKCFAGIFVGTLATLFRFLNLVKVGLNVVLF